MSSWVGRFVTLAGWVVGALATDGAVVGPALGAVVGPAKTGATANVAATTVKSRLKD